MLAKLPKKIKIHASFLVLLIFSSSILAETVDVLAIDYPPFTAETEAERGPLFILLQDYASKHMPAKHIRSVFLPPARASLLLSKGKYCLSFFPPPQPIMGEFEFIALSDENVRLGLIRERQPTAFSWEDLADLKGKSVAILRPGHQSGIAKQVHNAGLDVVYVETITQGLKMLEKKRVDYTFGDNTTLLRLSVAAGIDKSLYQFSDTSLYETIVGFNLRKSCKEELFSGASAL